MSTSLGKWGEKKAVGYLKRHDFEIIEMNYRNQRAEIDIVAQKKNMIIFVEVKTRQTKSHGYGYEAITSWKRKQLIKAAKLFYQQHQIVDKACRFDVISIYKDQNTHKIIHYENAFGENEIYI